MSSVKSVYIALSSDILHQGHLSVIAAGAELGEVTVGLLTDRAIATYKRPPILDFESRRALVASMRNVARVVPQETLSYAQNLRQLTPDYVVHGDDWATGVQAMVRNEVIEILAEYGGTLVEVPATEGLSGSELERALRPLVNTTELRRGKLRRLLGLKPYLRAIEASNGLSALIVEHVKVTDSKQLEVREYDAMWVSSLCDSTFKGKPDIELV
ncbi:MAG: adenylyltransferase/cytidyltransferase family protein, partial [Propionibacteriaceae bacterium]|nr:adenylyltransferase/cytidyltransferase family protein [Propionibacteriaceae bacterium]